MKYLILSVLLLTSSLSFAVTADESYERCSIGASDNEVKSALSKLRLAGTGLIAITGNQADALAALNRVTKPSGLHQTRFDYAKSLSQNSVKAETSILNTVALDCNRGEVVNYFNIATEIIQTALNGLKK